MRYARLGLLLAGILVAGGGLGQAVPGGPAYVPGVTKLIAGTGVSLSPSGGTGAVTVTATGSGGTVTSVGLADGSTAPFYTISSSPVTGSGTLTFTLVTQTANCVFAGPTTGSAAQPTCRGLVAADIPTLPSTQISGLGTAATVNTGTSGATIPLLNGTNTWSGPQSFGTITSQPTAAATTDAGNVGYVLAQGGLPFILVNGCTISAAGALSGCAALPQTFANAFMYFPQATLAGSSTGSAPCYNGYAAGFYYVAMSGTQAGTAYLNCYVSGTPTIPVSPTAVSGGSGTTFSTGTAAIQALTAAVPANVLGLNGGLEYDGLLIADTTSATKTLSANYAPGSLSTSAAITTTGTGQVWFRVRNAGNAKVQFSTNMFQSAAAAGINGSGGAAMGSNDTTTGFNTYFKLTVSSTTSTYAILANYSIKLFPN